MTLTFYNVSDAPNVVNKSIGEGVSIDTVHPVENCDMLNPSFILNDSTAATTYNYVHVSAFGRYYFITGRQLIRGGRAIIYCTVDVLYTYSDKITNCIGTITRAENPKSKYIHDSKFPLIAKMGLEQAFYSKTPFSATNGYNYLLTVQGKSGGSP